MGLFDKKFCSICGQKIGLLGNRKLEDGNLCKDCAKKLSPWFSERRHSTQADIAAQLQYREQNQAAVQAFHTTRSIGRNYKVLLDEDAQKFMVTDASNIANANPDVLDFSQVTGCDIDVEEDRNELKQRDAQGNMVSYRPPRYEYSYDFYVTVRVNHPYFDDMRFRLNSSSVNTGARCMSNVPAGVRMTTTGVIGSNEYYEYLRMGEEIKQALTEIRQGVRQRVAEAAAPKTAVVCPCCGATTIPDASGCCEYCGGPTGA